MELGNLKKISVRQMWNDEAQDFTPWLANNIEELSKALGIEMEVENTEVSVGPYSADILAKDVVTGRYVVIENQIGKTNHDHLGKALTYGSVLDASTIVWIATEFTEEHKKALDWLNDHTTEDISFFGIQVELWQIDNSLPAVRFNVISSPNEAVREIARLKATGELTEYKKLKLDFWTKFREKLEKTKKFPSIQQPKPRGHFDVSLGKSGIHLSNVCSPSNKTIAVGFYIHNWLVEKMYPYLESRKEEIEKAIGQKLIWNPNPDARDKRIVLYYQTDLTDPAKVEKAVNWMVEYTIKFKEVFGKIIQEAQ